MVGRRPCDDDRSRCRSLHGRNRFLTPCGPEKSMRFAICNETFQGWNWTDKCRFVADTGYDGIEIAPFTLAEDIRTIPADERRKIRQVATDSGLDIVGLHWL